MAKFKKGQSGNPQGRPPHSVAQKITNCLALGKTDLIRECERQAYAGDSRALLALISLVYPKPRQTHERVSIPAINKPNLSLEDKIHAILAEIANGKLAPDIGSMLISSITGAQRRVDDDELLERLEALERGL